MPTPARKQTHARLFTGEIAAGQIQEAESILRREILPKLRKHRGFRRHQLFIKGNRFLWLTTWTECPGLGIISKWSKPIAPLLRGRLTHVRYTVGVQTKRAARRAGRRAQGRR